MQKNEFNDSLKSIIFYIEQIEKIIDECQKSDFKNNNVYGNFKQAGLFDDVLRYLLYIAAEANEISPEYKLILPQINWQILDELLEGSSLLSDDTFIWELVTNQLPNNKEEFKKLL